MSSEIPEALELSVGGEQQIVLPGLGAAGYLWSSAVEGDSGVVTVDWRHGAEEGPRQVAGASAAETATVIGQAPGEVTLKLIQARTWEKQANPRKQHVIRIVVS